MDGSRVRKGSPPLPQMVRPGKGRQRALWWACRVTVECCMGVVGPRLPAHPYLWQRCLWLAARPEPNQLQSDR